MEACSPICFDYDDCKAYLIKQSAMIWEAITQWTPTYWIIEAPVQFIAQRQFSTKQLLFDLWTQKVKRHFMTWQVIVVFKNTEIPSNDYYSCAWHLFPTMNFLMTWEKYIMTIPNVEKFLSTAINQTERESDETS